MTCSECNGTGEVYREKLIGGIENGSPWQSYWPYWTTCPECGGSGEAPSGCEWRTGNPDAGKNEARRLWYEWTER